MVTTAISITRLGIDTVATITNHAPERAAVIDIARCRRRADTALTDAAGTTLAVDAAGPRLASTVVARTAIVLTTGEGVALGVVVTTTEVDVVWIRAGVIDVADPTGRTLLIEVTSGRRRRAEVR